jgi:hypothetical protein
MTLKEKFNSLVPKEFGGMQEPLLSDCEKTADEFAIEFMNWCVNNCHTEGIFTGVLDDKNLLEIFKKEKGYE